LSRAQQRPRCFKQAHDFGRSMQTSKRRNFCPRPTQSAVLVAAEFQSTLINRYIDKDPNCAARPAWPR
jgi:hypothetical protein